MKLRNDPRLLYRGILLWPPRWVSERGENSFVGQESGILTHVAVAPDYDKCFLYMSNNEQTYVGCLLFENVKSCISVSEFLKRNIGKRIQAIGDLDILSN